MYNPLEGMMSNIIEEGDEAVFEWIDTISNPIERLQKRDLFYKAQRELTKRFKGEE